MPQETVAHYRLRERLGSGAMGEVWLAEELQDRLVAELVAGLRGQLPAERPEDTQSLEAYEACSKGLLNLREESQESIDRAIVFFERAVALDPGYARAHMLLGAALDLKGDYLTVPELSERALVSLDRAIALRPDSAEAWRYRGSALITLNRDAEALEAFENALARNPMDASAQSGIARVHFILRGDFARAAAAYERALALNPRAGWSALPLAHCATLLRDFPKAEAAARRAIELQQAFLSGRAGMALVGAHMRLGHAFALQARHREALEEYAREAEFVRSVDHALRGESGPALDCLERTAARRPRLTAARAAIEPALETLRDEPRFRATLQAIR